MRPPVFLVPTSLAFSRLSNECRATFDNHQLLFDTLEKAFLQTGLRRFDCAKERKFEIFRGFSIIRNVYL